jgi:DNA-binding NtrC family response regulator
MIVAPLESALESRPTFRLSRKATTLLLVEDDGQVRRLLQTILEYAGYTVLSAEDGQQAIEIATRASFDMLITDFQMPKMNGFVLAEQITKRRPRLPVLVISGAAMEDLPLEQIADLNWSFLPKPIDRIRLLETIDESFHSRFRSNFQYSRRLLKTHDNSVN